MGFFSSLKRFFTGTKIVGVNVFKNDLRLMSSDAQDYIDDGYKFNPHVYSAIEKILNPIKSLPWQLMRVKEGRQSHLKRYSHFASKGQILQAQIQKAHALEEIEGDHELLRLLERPNNLQGSTEFVENTLGFKLLTGNSYIWGMSPRAGANAGKPREMRVLPAHFMEPKADRNDPWEVVKYELESGKGKTFEPEEILHLKTWNPAFEPGGNEHLKGQSPFQSARRVIQNSNDTYTAMMKLMQNNGAVGVLSLLAEEDVAGFNGEEAASSLQQSWVEKYSGSNRTGKFPITGAKADWTQIGQTFDKMGFDEANNMTRNDIANVLGIRPELLGEKAKFENLKQARKDMIINVSIPLMLSFRDELNRWLVPKYGEGLFLDVDISSIPELQEDFEKLADVLKDAWWIKPNEKRVAMNYPKDEDTPEMEEYWIPQNLIPTSTGDLPKARKELNEILKISKNGIHANSNN